MNETVQLARVSIDGFSFYYAAFVDGTFGRWKWLDLVAFSRCLVPSHHVDHVRYFTAQLKPTPGSPRAHIRQGIYLNALRAQPRLSVHLGTFSKHAVQMPLAPPPKTGCEDGVVYLASRDLDLDGDNAQPTKAFVVKTEENGSDVNLATYLLRDGFKGLYDTAVVVSDDSDLLEPVRLVQRELGREVVVAMVPRKDKGKRQHRGSVFDGKVKFVREVRQAYLMDSQLPLTIEGKHGRLIQRPPEWGPVGVERP